MCGFELEDGALWPCVATSQVRCKSPKQREASGESKSHTPFCTTVFHLRDVKTRIFFLCLRALQLQHWPFTDGAVLFAFTSRKMACVVYSAATLSDVTEHAPCLHLLSLMSCKEIHSSMAPFKRLLTTVGK